MSMAALRAWVKRRDNPLSRAIYGLAVGMRYGSVPYVPAIHKPLYAVHAAIANGWHEAWRILWYTPLFKSRMVSAPRELQLFGGMPMVLGRLEMSVGERCSISGQVTINGRTETQPTPRLEIGEGCIIGWQTVISVGRRISLGNHCIISGRAFLAGYPGHPLDARARARGEPDTPDQVGDIILEDDVWLGTDVTVSAGVHIGAGTVVAGGSVVTKDLPAGVLAAGVPARVIRSLVPGERPAEAAS